MECPKKAHDIISQKMNVKKNNEWKPRYNVFVKRVDWMLVMLFKSFDKVIMEWLLERSLWGIFWREETTLCWLNYDLRKGVRDVIMLL